jgi:NTE family protein
MTVAYVLGGGGVLGAGEVGMLRALIEHEIYPDLILGTSVGAINGALIAKDPTLTSVTRLTDMWSRAGAVRDFYSTGALATVKRAVTSKTHLYSSDPIKEMLEAEFGDANLEDLLVQFQVCAACIERASEHWFETGRIVDAVMASASVPGLWPPHKIDGEHFLDGGIVNSIPVGRAGQLGADVIYVLQVGRIDRPLSVPQSPVDVARVSFEIARRHRFVRELNELPEHVTAHVLPVGGTSPRDDSIFAHRDFTSIPERIESSYQASAKYLQGTLG